jgi:ABC-type multidrug transport system fused ATPase/permease subunit
MWGMIAMVTYVMGRMAIAKMIEPGDLVVLMNIIYPWGSAFAALFSAITEFRTGNISCSKLVEIMQREKTIPLHRGREFREVSGQIQFKDVVFKYPGRSENALDGLSFTVNAGERVAIVGESGCGKSTTLTLTQRFYDVASGSITLDGRDLRELKPRFIRESIAIVPQTPVLFTMSVKDNVRFGRPRADREEVVRAAKMANAHEFIVELPMTYRQMVAQSSLSGGQKQRICIARAIMMGSPVLLLDEATAALDTENEKLVQDALDSYGCGRTTIVVAHRLATVAQASRILVMEHGRIVQTGTHEELLADERGVYAHLVRHQLQ